MGKDWTAWLLEELRTSLEAQCTTATFVCGGGVQFCDDIWEDDSPAGASDGHQCPAVTLRFGENGKGSSFTCPDFSLNREEEDKKLQALIDVCGLDEDLGTASTLDSKFFTTDFCPYRIGIIDAVKQIILPQLTQGKEFCTIRADLRKLNIYSAPGGHFRAHTVKSTEDPSHFGTLVVSVPVPQTGGEATVSDGEHPGVTLDERGNPIYAGNEPYLEWAAYINGCTYQVKEVSEGHRLTLTYDLFAVGRYIDRPIPAADAEVLPLTAAVTNSVGDRRVFRHGRVLAVWLRHSYAHTSKHVNFLPEFLKGSDLALYQIARNLKLQCQLLPLMDTGMRDSKGRPIYVSSKGNEFQPFAEINAGANDPRDFTNILPNGKITWINETQPGTEEVQLAVKTHIPIPRVEIKYSRAAMLIRIPPWRDPALPDTRANWYLREQRFKQPFWNGIRDDDVPWGQDPGDNVQSSSEEDEEDDDDDEGMADEDRSGGASIEDQQLSSA